MPRAVVRAICIILLCGHQLGWAQADAQAWYEAGLQAMQRGNFSVARAALERAVQTDPGFAGAWLDLAIATGSDGDLAQAEEFLEILVTRFVLPQALAERVAALRERWHANAAQSRAGRVSDTAGALRGQWQMGGGRDSNANAGLAARELSLTTPGGTLSLPLARDYLPRPDTYASARVAVQQSRTWGDGQLDLRASARSRQYHTEHNFNTAEWLLGASYVAPNSAVPWIADLAVDHIYVGSRQLRHRTAVSFTRGVIQSPCAPQVQAEAENRRFPQASQLNSWVYWVGVVVRCGATYARLRSGYEAAPESRPSGNTRHAEVSIGHHWAWDNWLGPQRLDLLMESAQAADSRGYNPLLQDNQPRQVRRLSAGAAYTFPLSVSSVALQGVVTVFAFRQTANIELFGLQGISVQFSVQRNW